MKLKIRLPLLIFALILLFAATSYAASASFSWLPNTETDLAGYKIYYGTTRGGPYPNSVDVGKPEPVDGRVHGSVENLEAGKTYYFVAVAYNTSALESDYSTEATFTCTNTPADTIPPTGTITIDNGAASTTITTVTLTLTATDTDGNVAQMKFSNNNVDWSTPENFTASKTWLLESTPGTKTVYVRFSDNSGNWSASFSDQIKLVDNTGQPLPTPGPLKIKTSSDPLYKN